MAYQLLSIIAGLGVCCFIACANGPRQLLHYALGLVFMTALTGMPTIGWGLSLSFEPAQIGIITAITAIYCLQPGSRPGIAVFFAGVLSAVWIISLQVQGIPMGLSAGVIVTMALITFFASIHRAGFASAHYRQEALLIILAGGLFVGLVPEVIDSWQSAVNLQEIDNSQGTNSTGAGILLIVLGFLPAAVCSAGGKIGAMTAEGNFSRKPNYPVGNHH